MPEARARVVLAFDFGQKRIGIAAGDTLTRTAAPRSTATMGANGPDWSAIDREVRLMAPDLLVVGAPYNDDGTPGRIAPAANAFASQLQQRYGLAVERIDESYSSAAAASTLREQRASGQRRRAVQKGDLDSAAAAIILGSWLERQTQGFRENR
jgi:putative Holliday junction resolvase